MPETAHHATSDAASATWPALPLNEWRDTYATLHMWTQVVGKVRLALSPMINQWWQVTLYVTSRGLTTSPIPYEDRTFEIEFDFEAHRLVITTSDGQERAFALEPMSVAAFYRQVMAALATLAIKVHIWTMPVEVPNPIPFEQDEMHASYDREYAQRFWRILVQSARVLTEFRGDFVGKCSPVHFFWGSFDLAVTRFSGRKAPVHPPAPNISDRVTREAYSHEVSSCGWWPGGGGVDYPAYYAYAYPAPPGFEDYRVRPVSAFFSEPFGEFILPYDTVRDAPSPDEALLAFCQSTYEAAANLAHWDRAALERQAA